MLFRSDRIELNDGGEQRRRTGADKLPDRYLTRGHDAVERSGHVGVAEIDLGLLLIGLRRLQIGLRRIALRQRLVVVRLGRNLFDDQFFLALELGLGLLEIGLRTRLLRARLVDEQVGGERTQRRAASAACCRNGASAAVP